MNVVINSDETGHKLVLEGNRAQKGSNKIWVWVFATPNAAYYHVDLTRGQDAIKTAKPPPICISDAYSSYMNMFEINQYCWAHLLRNTKDVEDTCLQGKMLHDEMVDLFQKIKAIQKKLREKNEPASDKVYEKALNDINEIAEGQYGACVEKIQNHLKRRGEYYLTC